MSATAVLAGGELRYSAVWEDHRLVEAYKRLLEWEIICQPRTMKVVERAASPILGESYVVYARKATEHVAAA